MEYYLPGISALFSLALSELSSDQSMSVTATRTSSLPAMAVCPPINSTGRPSKYLLRIRLQLLILFFIRGDGGHSVRCILHIGTEKTGSTSLQTALSVNREHLSERGIFYSKAAGSLNSRALAAAFCQYSSDDYLARLGIEGAAQHDSWRNNLLDKIRGEVVCSSD